MAGWIDWRLGWNGWMDAGWRDGGMAGWRDGGMAGSWLGARSFEARWHVCPCPLCAMDLAVHVCLGLG